MTMKNVFVTCTKAQLYGRKHAQIWIFFTEISKYISQILRAFDDIYLSLIPPCLQSFSRLPSCKNGNTGSKSQLSGIHISLQMGLDAIKPVFGVSDKAKFKPVFYLENWNFAFSKLRYDTYRKANNKGADLSARMRRQVCAFVIRKPPKTGFLTSGPKFVMPWKT